MSSPIASLDPMDVIIGRVESLESSVFGTSGVVSKDSVILQPRVQEIESRFAAVTQKISNYHQIQESFSKLGFKSPLDELTSNLLADMDKKIVDIQFSRTQLDSAIKQLQIIESHRRTLSADPIATTSSDVSIQEKLDSVEVVLHKLAHEVHQHTAELDLLLSAYEALMIDFSDTLVDLNARLRVLEQSS